MPKFLSPPRTRSAQRRSGRSGDAQNAFTLLEVLGVAGLILILSTLAVARYGSFQKGTKLEGEARAIFDDIGNSRSQAMKKDVTYMIRFNASARAYEIYEDKNGNGAPDADEMVSQKAIDSQIAFGSPPKGPAKGPGGTGTPAAGIEGAWASALVLANDRAATLNTGSLYLYAPGLGHAICIRQSASSRRLEMWRWDGGAWAPM